MAQGLIVVAAIVGLQVLMAGLFTLAWHLLTQAWPGAREYPPLVAVVFLSILAAVIWGIGRALRYRPKDGKRSGEVSPGRHHQS